MNLQDIKQNFQEKGWVVVNQVFTLQETEHLRNIVMTITEAEIASGRSYAIDKSADGKILPRKIADPSEKHHEFKEFLLNERLEILLKTLLNNENPLLASDQAFLKPPHFGSEKPYHQDNSYFHCEPADSLITAWIALEDVDEENGCLRYINGSHKSKPLPFHSVPGENHNQKIPDEYIDFSKEESAIVKQGGVVFHGAWTVHTSHRNTSNRWRRAYATHWATNKTTSTTNILNNLRDIFQTSLKT